VKRRLGDGLELDDDKARVDREAVHRYLGGESYWAKGRPRAVQDRLIEHADRVVGLYDGAEQIGFCRAFTDGVSIAYLADVYVLEAYRGRGLGETLVRAMIDESGFGDVKWLLHTTNMHALYRKLGFGEPSFKVLERLPPEPS
jgi:ribosomal protein S18 acetylase RimI-like enzyme